MNLKHLLTKLNPWAKKEPPPTIEPEEQVIIPEVVEDKTPLNPPEPQGKLDNRRFGKGVKPQSYKFSEADKSMIVTWFALGFTRSEIIERAKEELNIEISPHQIYLYAQAEKWQALIRKVRNENMNDIAAVAGSHKKVRLERAEKVFDKALKSNKLKEALSATEHQRKEMEGGGDMVNLTLNQFNVLSDEELEYKKKQVIERIKLMTDNKEKKA